MKTTNLFNQASLAEASYANLENVSGGKPLEGKLIANEFSDAQAAEFVKHWKVAHHQGNTASGYSATLFESLDNSGEYTFAIRGTELAGHPRGIFDKFGDNSHAQGMKKKNLETRTRSRKAA